MPPVKKIDGAQVLTIPEHQAQESAHKAVGVMKRPDGLWIARIYEIDEAGRICKVVKESAPDIRAVAIERLHVFNAQTFLL